MFEASIASLQDQIYELQTENQKIYEILKKLESNNGVVEFWDREFVRKTKAHVESALHAYFHNSVTGAAADMGRISPELLGYLRFVSMSSLTS